MLHILATFVKLFSTICDIGLNKSPLNTRILRKIKYYKLKRNNENYLAVML